MNLFATVSAPNPAPNNTTNVHTPTAECAVARAINPAVCKAKIRAVTYRRGSFPPSGVKTSRPGSDMIPIKPAADAANAGLNPASVRYGMSSTVVAMFANSTRQKPMFNHRNDALRIATSRGTLTSAVIRGSGASSRGTVSPSVSKPMDANTAELIAVLREQLAVKDAQIHHLMQIIAVQSANTLPPGERAQEGAELARASREGESPAHDANTAHKGAEQPMRGPGGMVGRVRRWWQRG